MALGRRWARERRISGPANTLYADNGALVVRLERFPSGWIAAVWEDPDGAGRRFLGYWLGLGQRTTLGRDTAPRARTMRDLKMFVNAATDHELRTNVTGDL